MQSDCVDLLHVRTYKQNISNIYESMIWRFKINHPKLWDQNLPGPGASPHVCWNVGNLLAAQGCQSPSKIEDRKSAFLDFACTPVENPVKNVMKNSKSCVFWGSFLSKISTESRSSSLLLPQKIIGNNKDFHWNLVILFESNCRMGADLVFWLVWGLECFQGELLEIPELHAGGRSCCETAGWLVAVDLFIPGPSSLGTKWFRCRVSINHPIRV